MFSSTRSRLTLWYTAVLALVLIIFAILMYVIIARSLAQRADQSLVETAATVVSNFALESGDEGNSSLVAAQEVAQNFRTAESRVWICDAAGNVVAASSSPETAPTTLSPDLEHETTAALRALVQAAQPGGRAFATQATLHGPIRLVALATTSQGRSFFIVVVHSLNEQNATLVQTRNALLIAVPLALALASLGGYFLARKSLAPVAAMGASAARISADNLAERLPLAAGDANELGRLARTFNELLARLDAAFAQQRQFMADASHELRTPVAIICGESEVALSKPDRSAAEYREALTILLDEGRRLTRVVEDLFMLSRADAGQYRMQTSNVYLDETVQECVHAVRSLAAKREIGIDYVHAGADLAFACDEALIQRMFINVLDNAIKYTPTGGQVRVDLVRNALNYTVRVSDNGPGIPVDAQSQVFERFFRVDKARQRDASGCGSGAGLGLAIARWIADLHGGSVWLKSSDAGGSTFEFTLPLV